MEVSDFNGSRMLKWRGRTQKYIRGATERNVFLKAAWRLMVGEAIDTGRLVYEDECDATTRELFDA